MFGETDKLLIYFEDEEHLVRRLGAAVVSLWSAVPGELQSRLIEKAKRVLDETETDKLDQQIKGFLAHYAPPR